MPLDTNIAMGGKLFKMTDPMENAQNAELIRKSRFDNNQAERGLAAENKLAQLLAQGGDEQAVSQGLYGEGYYNKAQDYQKSQIDKRKAAADIAKTGQETSASQFKLQKDKSDRLLNAVGSLAFKNGVTKQDIYSVIGGLVNDGTVDEDMADQMAMDVDATPDTDLYKLLHKTGRSLIDAKTQYEMAQKERDAEYRAMNDEKNRKNRTENSLILAGSKPLQLTKQGDAVIDRNGVLRPFVDEKGVVVKPKGITSLSPTLQKELIQTDEELASGQAALALIKKAKGISDKAYEGFGASTLATAASNLGSTFGVDTPNADSTVSLKNIITTQALESLKTMFGGNPTEGERAILVDIQAAPEKTAKQREEIFNRTIAAIDRRLRIAKGKSAAIRAGKYLTEEYTPGEDVVDNAGGWSAEEVQ